MSSIRYYQVNADERCCFVLHPQALKSSFFVTASIRAFLLNNQGRTMTMSHQILLILLPVLYSRTELRYLCTVDTVNDNDNDLLISQKGISHLQN